jgi:hypothetical protein
MFQIMVQSLLRTSKRLRSIWHLAPPTADSGPKRKDQTGFIFLLLALTLVIAVVLLA